MTSESSESKYQDIFASRYVSNSPLVRLFSEQNKSETWRKLWCWLAQAEFEAGIPQIKQEQVDAMYSGVSNIDFEFVRRKEAETRHDVMAHIAAFEQAVPQAAGIIHLGATSAFVQDNADILIIRDALDIVIPRLVDCIRKGCEFALAEAGTPTVGLTHYQPATLTTVGKRSCLWIQELLTSLTDLLHYRDSIRFRGIQGATGSRASFLSLFSGDREKVKSVNQRVFELATQQSPLAGHYTITGQTYSRHEDCRLLSRIASFGAAAHRMCMDIRILQSRGELMEPFAKDQVGSSAMPYKRNPMKCERVCGLSRLLLNLPGNALDTASVQGFERTLDDSSNRRVTIPQAFLTMESVLVTLQNVLSGLRVIKDKVNKNVMEELPFLAMEPVLMLLTQHGASRQTAHHKIREAALAAHGLREKGERVNLVSMLEKDSFFDPVRNDLASLSSDPTTMIGDCPNQVKEFVELEVSPVLKRFEGVHVETKELKV